MDESHSIYFMSALPRMKSATIVRSKDTIPECAKLKDKRPRELRGKPIKNQMHQCTILVKNKNSKIPPRLRKPCIIRKPSQAEFHSIKINDHDVRMQNDTGSSVTIISRKVWRKIGSPTLSTSPRWIEAYDGHRMLYLDHLK